MRRLGRGVPSLCLGEVEKIIGVVKRGWLTEDCRDFFKDDWFKQVEGGAEGGFDVIYDYTVCT